MRSVQLATLPNCDIHTERVAKYDEPIDYNGRRTWAYTCEDCHDKYGMGSDIGSELEVAE